MHRPAASLPFLFLLAVIGLSGCLDSAPGASPELASSNVDPGTQIESGPRLETYYLNGSIVAQATVPIGIEGVDAENGLLFKSRGNVSRIVVNLSWENVPGMDLDALLLAEEWCGAGLGATACMGKAFALGGDPENGVFSDAEGTPAAPDNPSILDLDAAALGEWAECGGTCDWLGGIWTRGAAQVDYQMRIDVYYEDSPVASEGEAAS